MEEVSCQNSLSLVEKHLLLSTHGGSRALRAVGLGTQGEASCRGGPVLTRGSQVARRGAE